MVLGQHLVEEIELVERQRTTTLVEILTCMHIPSVSCRLGDEEHELQTINLIIVIHLKTSREERSKCIFEKN